MGRVVACGCMICYQVAATLLAFLHCDWGHVYVSFDVPAYQACIVGLRGGLSVAERACEIAGQSFASQAVPPVGVESPLDTESARRL